VKDASEIGAQAVVKGITFVLVSGGFAFGRFATIGMLIAVGIAIVVCPKDPSEERAQ
jgi:hypothetical protein